MPAARHPDRSRIEDALAALSQALTAAGAPWMVIGGIAVIAHGVQRMTTDIDAVIQGDAVSVRALLTALRRHRIEPRIDQAEAFAEANMVLLVRHQPTEVDLDLSFGWTAFEHEALAARVQTRYGAVIAPMARVEELLVFKALAGRPRDIDDAVTLLTLYPRTELREVRRQVAELAALAEAPEIAQGFEEIVRAASSPPRPRKPPSTKPRPAAKTTSKPRPAAKKTSKPRGRSSRG